VTFLLEVLAGNSVGVMCVCMLLWVVGYN